MMRFGLIGLGRFGKHYLRLLTSLPEVELLAIANHSSGVFSEYKEKIPPQCITTIDTNTLLQNPAIDCIVIATPATTHFDLIQKALLAGKHVLVEKPMVTTAEEAKKIETLAKKQGKTLMVGYQYIYHDAIRYLKTSFDFGNVNYFFGEHLSSGPVRTDVGCFMDAGVHDLAIIEYLFAPGRIAGVKGASAGTSDDFTAVSVTFESGLFAHLVTSWIAPEKVRKVTIVGENGSAVLDD
ncbi:MAG: Gfo/Idh/MocA family oxidoreductase, partial [Patescibacteria group bacterium]